MRTLKILVIALFAFLSLSTFAQNSEIPSTPKPSYEKDALQIAPFGFFRHTLQVGYIKRLKGGKQSLVVTPSIVLKKNDNESTTGIKAGLQYRFYLNYNKFSNEDKNVRGYAAPYYRFSSIKKTDSDVDFFGETILPIGEREGTMVSNEAGLLMGFEIKFFERMHLDLFAGGGARFSNNEGDNWVIDDSIIGYGYTGIKPTIGLNVGFSF